MDQEIQFLIDIFYSSCLLQTIMSYNYSNVVSKLGIFLNKSLFLSKRGFSSFTDFLIDFLLHFQQWNYRLDFMDAVNINNNNREK